VIEKLISFGHDLLSQHLSSLKGVVSLLKGMVVYSRFIYLLDYFMFCFYSLRFFQFLNCD
jgi:hypothetical protein